MTGLFKHWRQAARNIFPEKRDFFRAVKEKIMHLRLAMRPSNLRWIKRRGPGLLGWPGAAGVGLLSLCLALYFSAILPVRDELASARHSVLSLQEQMNQGGPWAKTRQRSPEEQLAGFYGMFPDSSHLPASLEKIFALAQSQGIGLDKGEYKVIRSKEGNLVSFQVIFPVKGEYLQIRKYLMALTASIPVLSLQQVQFKRQNIGDPVVEANIKLALYLLERKS